MRGGLDGGIYVHFPFCRHRCFYCDFNLVTPKVIPQRRYTDALLAELRLRASQLPGPARSLYFGGGTPSLWEAGALKEVIVASKESPGLQREAEVTLEANPNDIRPDLLDAWLSAGVNRLSIGVQSFDSATLVAIDRQHTGERAFEAIESAIQAGFEAITVDLMYGLPGQTLADWDHELAAALETGVNHLSVYGLTVEETTPLYKMVDRREVVLPTDEMGSAMFLLAHDRLEAAGWIHYEISGYARPGHRAIHNSGYWEFRPYLGLGAGAHGFDGASRWENIRRVKTYMDVALAGTLPMGTQETLDPQSMAFERLMVGFRRLREGVVLQGDLDVYQAQAKALEARGWLERHHDAFRVTREGMLWMNKLLAEFL